MSHETDMVETLNGCGRVRDLNPLRFMVNVDRMHACHRCKPDETAARSTKNACF